VTRSRQAEVVVEHVIGVVAGGGSRGPVSIAICGSNGARLSAASHRFSANCGSRDRPGRLSLERCPRRAGAEHQRTLDRGRHLNHGLDHPRHNLIEAGSRLRATRLACSLAESAGGRAPNAWRRLESRALRRERPSTGPLLAFIDTDGFAGCIHTSRAGTLKHAGPQAPQLHPRPPQRRNRPSPTSPQWPTGNARPYSPAAPTVRVR
jgi:hypothetical protein